MNLILFSLENMKLKELYEYVCEYKVLYYSKLMKKEFVFVILKV